MGKTHRAFAWLALEFLGFGLGAGVARAAGEERLTAAGVERRAAELSRLARREVLVEVTARGRELGVKADAAALTDQLGEVARFEIEIDRCRLSTGARCGGLEASLARLEAEFLAAAGLSMREFRSGRRTPPSAAPAELEFLAPASGEICFCSFSVYSSERWMNRYWGLECNNHGGHGVCSTNVDSLHSAGIGAMTGRVELFYGASSSKRNCPDDHSTCFRGPANGEWGNVCNCDTWHSQFYNPSGAWYGGDLTDGAAIWQLSTGTMSAAGTCASTYLVVQEFIQEHDPWCCDDPMGTLSVSLPVQDGYGSVSGQASAQNCNGGSQSGVYPYCGTFGATLQVVYNCSTYVPPPPDPNTCRGNCFNTLPEANCSCELGCSTWGNCCYDFQEQCCDPYPQWNGCF